ncbi:TIGR03943 family protein [Shimazuella sp. AN120528]|uniref:TIGR03943 family putative permease subunit n=1 Tax=Shimazuella soli TaxID=1892854 RepID=UPI001F0EB3BB|nr:TIGR03943 family protein [Shimazuella soli]MCH5586381.1 TIGR03943 family protein [Shimazuella soli]
MVRAWIRILICMGIALMLIGFVVTKEITLLVAPKMVWFVGFSIFVLMVFSLVQIWQLKGKELHRLGFSSYLLVLFPIFLFLFAPPKVLDASVANKKGVHYSKPNSQQEAEISPSDDPYAEEFAALKKLNIIKITDSNYGDVLATIQIHPKELSGKQIQVKGFVYKDDTTGKNQFIAGRYLIVCCVADAEVAGYLVNLEHQKPLPENKWVEVTGKLKTTVGQDGTVEPIIFQSKIQMITAPKDPYVYFN